MYAFHFDEKMRGNISILTRGGWVLCAALVCAGCADRQRLLAPTTPAPTDESRLDAELLYALLLADIAGQRGRNEVAAESLSRAAELSLDARIVARAMDFAAWRGDHRRVIALSALVDGDLTGDSGDGDPRLLLLLANAHFATGDGEQALTMLIELARAQSDESTLRSIAALLAERPRDEQLLSRFRHGIEALPQDAALNLTAALLASALDEGEAFRELIDATLKLRPSWQTPAMLKLDDLDAENMPVYADGFLRAHPTAEIFRIHYGKILQHNGQVKQALAQFETVLRDDPQSAEALFLTGVAHLERGELQQSSARLQASLALDPQRDLARLYLADINMDDDDFDATAALLNEIASPAYYIDVESRRAFVVAHRHDLDAGVRHLSAMEVQSEDEAVRVMLAQSLLYQDFDEDERAMDILNAGLETLPDHPDLLYNRGLLAARLDDIDLHERDMRALLKKQPDNAQALNALGYTLADEGVRLHEALALIESAHALRPHDAHILDSIGWVHFRLGNLDTAVAFLYRALDAQKNAEIAAHLGEALWVSGERREARGVWMMGKTWSPDDPVLLETLRRFGELSSTEPL